MFQIRVEAADSIRFKKIFLSYCCAQVKVKERNLFYRASNNSTYYVRSFLEHLDAITNLALTQIEPRA